MAADPLTATTTSFITDQLSYTCLVLEHTSIRVQDTAAAGLSSAGVTLHSTPYPPPTSHPLTPALPQVETLASALSQQQGVQVLKLRSDVPSARYFAKQVFQVHTYPTLLFFPAGSAMFYKYHSPERTAQALLGFINNISSSHSGPKWQLGKAPAKVVRGKAQKQAASASAASPATAATVTATATADKSAELQVAAAVAEAGTDQAAAAAPLAGCSADAAAAPGEAPAASYTAAEGTPTSADAPAEQAAAAPATEAVATAGSASHAPERLQRASAPTAGFQAGMPRLPTGLPSGAPTQMLLTAMAAAAAVVLPAALTAAGIIKPAGRTPSVTARAAASLQPTPSAASPEPQGAGDIDRSIGSLATLLFSLMKLRLDLWLDNISTATAKLLQLPGHHEPYDHATDTGASASTSTRAAAASAAPATAAAAAGAGARASQRPGTQQPGVGDGEEDPVEALAAQLLGSLPEGEGPLAAALAAGGSKRGRAISSRVKPLHDSADEDVDGFLTGRLGEHRRAAAAPARPEQAGADITAAGMASSRSAAQQRLSRSPSPAPTSPPGSHRKVRSRSASPVPPAPAQQPQHHPSHTAWSKHLAGVDLDYPEVDQQADQAHPLVVMDLHTALTAPLPGQQAESALTQEVVTVAPGEAQRLLDELMQGGGSSGSSGGSGGGDGGKAAGGGGREEAQRKRLQQLLSELGDGG